MPAATQAPDIYSQMRQISALPSELLIVAESQWLFTDVELLLAPSIVSGGLSPEKERENRSKGVNFILQAGIMLKLPQITLATASVFLHRFYMRHSMVDLPNRVPGYHYYSMAATCLFLATKVEENCRKMKELVVACVRVAQKDPNKLVDEQDKEYWRWRDNILHSEDVLLEALCFDLSLEAPYKTLFELLVQVQHETHKRLRNAAWAFVNDSCLTMLCLLFSSKTIAASALYMAAKHVKIAFPDDERGRPWWQSAGVDIVDVRRACNYMAEAYENVPPKPGRDGVVYERTPENLDEGTDLTRDMGKLSTEHPSQGSSVEGEERRPLKRERVEGMDIEESLHTKGTSTQGAHGKANGNREESPRKRVKIEGNDVQHSPKTSLEVQKSSGTGPPHPEDIEMGAAEVLLDADMGGLVSPNLDEVREEGEVED